MIQLSQSLLLALVMLLAVVVGMEDAAADDYDAALKRAEKLVETSRPAEATEILRGLTAAHPDRPEAFNNLAVLYARDGRLEQARDLLTRSINTHPSYATTFRNLNEVLAQLAAQAYRRALGDGAADRVPPTRLAAITTAVPPPGSRPAVAAATPALPSPTPATPSVIPPRPASAPPPPATVAAAPPTPAAPPVAPAATPSAEPSPTSRPPDPRLAEVLSTLYGWARAWSDQDVARYLSYYGPGFTPRRGMSRDAWQAQRRARVSAPASIRVDVTGPSVSFDGTDRARVRFTQRYRSDRLDSTVAKTLTLRKRDDRWKIVEERV